LAGIDETEAVRQSVCPPPDGWGNISEIPAPRDIHEALMLHAFRLIPAIQLIFKSKFEFTSESFGELTEQQYEAYERKVGKRTETLYRVLPFEPTVLDSGDENVRLLEITIVTENERRLLLEGVAFIFNASAEMKGDSPTFEERLEYLRPRLPPIVTGDV